MQLTHKRSTIFIIILIAALLVGALFLVGLTPVSRSSEKQIFVVDAGTGFRTIAANLKAQGLIRSKTAFKIVAGLSGKAWILKSGRYLFAPSMSSQSILRRLTAGPEIVAVRIPEGSSVRTIDALLSGMNVLKSGELTAYAREHDVEGRLFPDTYDFFLGSTAEQVATRFLENFAAKTKGIFPNNSNNSNSSNNSNFQPRTLIIASLLEREVPEYEDRRVVAGVIEKRLQAGMPLQIDATICYVKAEAERGESCYPLSPADFKIASSYNTYMYPGLPPGPIGNPGVEAIRAALNPKTSPYWFYLSDPKTGKTIFAKTLDEQSANKAKYLR